MLGLALAGCGGSDTPEPSAPRAAPRAIAAPADGRWSSLTQLSLVPAAAANLPNGKVVLWAADSRLGFASTGRTYSSLFDPATGVATETLVSNTSHDMFCPGTSNLPDGRLLVNGGLDSAKTSLYDATTNAWSTGPLMNISRGYQANTVLEDGSVLTLGGSWSGGVGNKHGEVWTQAGGWRRLTGVPVTPFLSVDTSADNSSFGGDSHFWMVPAGNGRVFHAGPGVAMHWISTQGNGSVADAGPRGDDEFSVNGNLVMYDAGKLLKTGGAPNYEDVNANANSYVIDISAGARVRKIAPMAYRRAYHNSVVLPNGQVMIVGGMTFAKNFTDNTAVLRPELFDPATETFTLLPAIAVGRTYHSIALLLPDARVLSGGGGLCGDGCAANHPDLQIYTPHYLLNADGSAATRPAIASAPATATQGTRILVGTDTPVTAFSLVRLGSVTHSVNNDQRRVALASTALSATSYELEIPSNPGIVLPGYYMLFAMTAEGVPSVARMLRIGSTGAPTLTNPGDQYGPAGSAVSLQVAASSVTGYGAAGLPPGLAIDAATGRISGTPTQPGSYAVTLAATNAQAASSTTLLWTVAAAAPGVRYVRLDATSEVNGGSTSAIAEFNLLDSAGAVMSRSGWVAAADSADSGAAAANALDGNAATLWRSAPAAPLPHSYSVDLGAARTLTGFKMLPRNDGSSAGTIANWSFWTSPDNVNWTQVASGSFADLGGPTGEKTVVFTVPAANRAPLLAAVPDQSTPAGQAASLALSASDPDNDPLSYSAGGLPAGLAIQGTTGVISGTPTTPGTASVTVQVSDGRGGSASRSFAWTIVAAAFAIDPVPAAPVQSGSSANFSASSNGGPGVTYSWDFGDGTPPTAASTSATASHDYAAPGVYNVVVTAQRSDGSVTTRSFVQAVYAAPGATRPANSSNVAFEPRTGANPRVWLVNQDNDSVSVFDAVTLTKLAEPAVGAAPRSLAIAPDGRVWVANKTAATLSVLSPATLAVVQTVSLPRGSMPYGLAFAPDGSAAYLALEATGQLLKLNPTSGAVLGTLAVGANPRQVSIAAASNRVLVSRFVTPPLPGEATAAVDTSAGGGGVVVVTPSLAIEATVVLGHSNRPDTATQGMGVPNYLGAAVIAPDGASAWVPSKQDNIRRGTLRNGSGLDFQNTVRAISSRIDLAALAEDGPARLDHDDAGLASAAAFHPTGAYLFVALQTSRRVAVIDPARRTELLRFDVGRAPDGLAVSADGLRLYVNNFMDRTLGAYDLSRLVSYGELAVPLLAAPGAVASERLAANVLQGKRLFYDARDPRLARDAYISCAVCHNDGGHDGRVWDFTGFGEGLRNTIALRGRAGAQGGLHWSNNFDEVQDFEGQIRQFAGGTGLMSDAQFNAGTRGQPLGDRKAGVSADLDALAAYVASLDTFAASPYRPSAGTLSASATEGKLLFASLNCASCHGGAAYTNSGAGTLSNIGTVKPTSGQRLAAALTGIDIPTLRDAWATAPYLHDGSAATLEAAIRAHNNVSANDADIARLAAYVREIGSDEGLAALPGGVGTIWSAQAVPAVASEADAASVNLGVKFRSDIAGSITGIRFYKGTANTGTHVGALWTSGGQLLASVTFGGETASGWQQANFATPVAISANTVYVASYLAPRGRYASNGSYFASAGFDNAPLHALRNGESGGNGVYAYAAGNTFPASTYQSTNYWVDVVFAPAAAGGDTTPPTVTGVTPGDGSSGVGVTSAVTATFSEALDASTIGGSTFELRSAAGALVAASVSYNAATRVATLTPSAALAASTGYTATLRGGSTDPAVKDSAGNRLASSRVWSFTTAAPADITPPTVTVVSPLDGSTGVALGASVSATFSEPLDAATISGSTFELRSSGGALVAASISYAAATRVATLTPSAALAPASGYTATLRGGSTDPAVKDSAGNRLASNRVWSFTTAAPPDTTPPTVSAVTPLDAATGVTVNAALTARFSEALDPASVSASSFELRDGAGALVAAGVSYDTATGVATLLPTAALASASSYIATLRGGSDPALRDLAGNRLAASLSWSFTTAAPSAAPLTLWSATTTPAVASDSDTASVNLGVKFRSDIAGYIVGVRFYKGSANTGAHVGALWSSSGTLLASAPYTGETASGWQQVLFDAPVAIAANTVYVASYLAPRGRYAANSSYFASAGVDNGTLHAPSSAAAGGNGVYAYGAATAFPGSTFQATNYWVDPVFVATPAADTAAPGVTATVPANNATGVSRTASLTATFSEAMKASSIAGTTFELRTAAGALVAATSSYSAATRVATLRPNATLAAATSYTVTLRGGATAPTVQDLAGNPLAASVSWSFRTP